MIWRGRAASVLALWLFGLAGTAQVVLLGGGTSTIANTQGGGITLYEPDATTQASLGYAQGVHLGVSREVRTGSTLLTWGDSYLSLGLPTDIGGYGRSIAVRGVTLEQADQRRVDPLLNGLPLLQAEKPARFNGKVFAGWAGDSYRNLFFSTVEPSSAVAVAEGDFRVKSTVDVSALAVQGRESSALASAAWTPARFTSTAVTVGWTAGHPILRARARTSGRGWDAETNYTTGAMHLQPDSMLSNLSLERIGWNAIVSKRVGTWLFLDASRHEYDTGSAQDSAANGVTAGRSTLHEGGVTVRLGHLEAGVRGLSSASGARTGSGSVYIAAWNSRWWSVRSTFTDQISGTQGSVKATSLDGSEQVCPHLRLTQSATFASNMPTFDFGGAYENRFGSLSVTHHETYVPFGNDAGFHRVLSVGIHVHVGSTEISADQVSGHGLSPMYDVAVNGFYGDSLGGGAPASSSMPSQPKYSIYGIVKSATGDPIRGAAVKAGGQTVYTDSEGHFSAKFARAVPVRVALSTAQFLTAEDYEASTVPFTVVPAALTEGSGLVLQVKRCNACNEAFQQTETEAGELASEAAVQHSLLQVVRKRMSHLLTRMVKIVPARQSKTGEPPSAAA